VSFYPDIRAGDDIVFSTNPNDVASQWRYGKVATPKNNSADIVLFSEGVVAFRHDCLHADDPRVSSTRLWAEPGRGVFKLAQSEIERRDTAARLPSLEKKITRLEANLESLVMSSGKSHTK